MPLGGYARSMATESSYSQLPPRVRVEDTRTSQDVVPQPEELEDRYRETNWLLRGGASG
ncbi:hypothetical protein SAMN04489844_3116 [Nocardioides exalbidus]|uniref:Uncharacterized protein n=1 Tax=Nocardioides exalbidus TaxID=402596 RepID=A0A1H4VVQ8_9ACTN|nr:hypothetical protein SAMN04489844_3116 [Nocardioides exalbidus]